MEFTDWNKKSLDDLVEYLDNKYQFDSSGEAKAIFELIEFYKKNKDTSSLVMLIAFESFVDGYHFGQDCKELKFEEFHKARQACVDSMINKYSIKKK